MTAPLVSIIIPTYNRASYLRKTLESAVRQTYPSLEIVVLDDASTDETPWVVKSINDERCRYLRHSANKGPNGNWKAGMKTVEGDYFAFLADDDVLEPSFVERLVNPLLQNNDLILSFCDHWVIDDDGKRQVQLSQENSQWYGRDKLGHGPVGDFVKTALVDEAIYIGAVMFRRSFVSPSFLSPVARSAMGGWILYNCIKTGHEGYYVPERLMGCRWQQGSVSRSKRWLGSVTAGTLARYRRMLKDPELAPYHGTIRGHLATMLSVQGRMHLREGRPSAARRVLEEALEIRWQTRDLLFYCMSKLGPVGTQFSKALYWTHPNG